MTIRADIVRAHFHDHFGEWPLAVFRAPGRVTVIGDHTDYQGGLALSMALPMATWVAAGQRPAFSVRAGTSHNGSWADTTAPQLREAGRTPPLSGWAGLLAGVWSVLPTAPGASVWVESDLPVGVGLSSSAAITLGLLAALTVLGGQPIQLPALTRLAQRVENEFLGVPSGLLDQLSIAMAQPRSALLIDAAAQSARPVAFPYRDAGYRMWVIDTGSPRTLQAAGYRQRVQEAAAAAAALSLPSVGAASEGDVARLTDPLLARRARHIVTESARVRAAVDAAAHGHWAHVMALLNDSHASLAADYEVSSPRLDQTAARLRQLGVGARVTGAGFGGSLVAMGPAAQESGLLSSLTTLYEQEGWPAPLVRPILYPNGGLMQVGG